MLSVSSTTYKKISVLGIVWMCFLSAQAQTENSPYSRYGLGDLLPGQNILNRSMGGVSAAYSDFHTVNFLNPASYSKLKYTTLDFGVEVDNRTLRALDPPRKFSSSSPIISYLQLGIPLALKKDWGMNIGLRPVTRINYKIERNERVPGIDSLNTLFEGNGGAYEVYTGTGFGIKNFSVGVNVGYLFGSKNFSTRKSFIPDSSNVFYYQSNHETQSNYNGLLLNGGVQYKIKLDKGKVNGAELKLGAHGSLKRSLNASKDIIRETFQYNSTTGAIDSLDVASNEKDIEGKVEYPSSFGAGFLFEKPGKWMAGADLSLINWDDYRFFGETDQVQNSWKLHVGGQVIPKPGKNYLSYVAYRLGFEYGKDYIKIDKDLPVWGFSAGASFPMRKAAYTNQYSMINLGIEFGQRGNKDNLVRENFFRFSVGLSLSDLWFVKRKYD
ncbi:MAG: hypothetical protein H7122_02145 [Chitinophagaceae bacterium]|nr:hypothetical protein [Chitinophagaceae bacterium]